MRTIFTAIAVVASLASWAHSASPVEVTKQLRFQCVTIDLPYRLKERRVQGLDSIVGEYRSKDVVISYDFGMYCNRLEDVTPADTVTEFDVGASRARLVKYNDQGSDKLPYRVAIFVKDPCQRDVQLEFGPNNTLYARFDITISAACRTRTDQDRVEQAFRSIHLRQ